MGEAIRSSPDNLAPFSGEVDYEPIPMTSHRMTVADGDDDDEDEDAPDDQRLLENSWNTNNTKGAARIDDKAGIILVRKHPLTLSLYFSPHIIYYRASSTSSPLSLNFSSQDLRPLYSPCLK